MRIVIRFVSGLFLVVVWCFYSSCNEIGYRVVTSQEFTSVEKLRTGDYELIRKDQLEELKREAQLGKGVGRYQIYSRGFRTWRLDTATGATCLLLTTEVDWKKPETSASGCYDPQ
jgi:hypothetical protein